MAVSVSTSTLSTHLLDALLLRHAEPLLLIDDEKAQIVEAQRFLQKLGVRADDQIDVARTPAKVP